MNDFVCIYFIASGGWTPLPVSEGTQRMLFISPQWKVRSTKIGSLHTIQDEDVANKYAGNFFGVSVFGACFLKVSQTALLNVVRMLCRYEHEGETLVDEFI